MLGLIERNKAKIAAMVLEDDNVDFVTLLNKTPAKTRLPAYLERATLTHLATHIAQNSDQIPHLLNYVERTGLRGRIGLTKTTIDALDQSNATFLGIPKESLHPHVTELIQAAYDNSQGKKGLRREVGLQSYMISDGNPFVLFPPALFRRRLK